MDNEERFAGTEAENELQPITLTTCQTIANTHVVGSQSPASREVSCEGKALNPNLSYEEIRKLSWRELPWYHTTEGTDWHHAEQMKKYDLSNPEFQKKVLITNYITIATGAILFLLLILEVLTIKR